MVDDSKYQATLTTEIMHIMFLTLPFYRAKYPQNIKKIRKNRFLLNKNQIFIQKTQKLQSLRECMGPNLLNIKKYFIGGPMGPPFFYRGAQGPILLYRGGPWGPMGPLINQ